MRFARLREREGWDIPPEGGGARLILVLYNLVWWIPVVLPFLGWMSYWAGFVSFFFVTLIRAAINVYRNNVMAPEVAARFPLRIP